MGIFGKRDQNSHRRQGLAAGASVSTPKLASPMALALEPRFMFDAAGAVTATDIATQAAADSLAAPVARNELVVVDTSVADYSTLIDGLAPGAQVLEIGAGQDGLQVLADALAASGQTYDAIHIVSHGSEGQVQLGASLLTAGSMASYTDVLTTLGSSLTADGDLLLYGCEVGTATGQAFVNDLAMLTGADVAASNDLTGAAALGGDWDLEVVAGTVETTVPFSVQALTDYSDVLALPASPTTFTLTTGGAGGFTDAGNTITHNYFTVGGGDVGSTGNMDFSGTSAYLNNTGLVADSQSFFSVTADGTNVATFQLTGVVVADSVISTNFSSVFVKGYVSGGGTVLSSTLVGTDDVKDTFTFSSAGNMSNLAGVNLTSFKVFFTEADANAAFTSTWFDLKSFTTTNAAAPSVDATITSSTYDASTGVVVVTGTNFTATGGATNDVIANKFTFTGEGGTYTLTDTANVEITNATSFTLTLSATDKAAINQLVNNTVTGTASTGGTTYDLDGAAGFIAAQAAIADTDANGVTVSNVANPTLASAAYNFSTNVMTVTGANFVHKAGATNDVDLSLLTVTGEGGGTYTLTTATDVEITNGTTFSFTLSGADLVGVESLFGRDGLTAVSTTAYNIAAAEDWMTGATTANNIASATNAITVSNYAVPAITSATTYDFSTGVLVFTGTNFVSKSGATNDIIANKFTFTGDGGATYTLTDTANVEVTSATAFTITLSATDRLAIGGLLNNNGSQSDTASNTTYNINAAEDWIAGAPATNNVVDATGNSVTVSNYTAPAITSAAYNYSTNVLTVTGTNFVNEVGATNDVDISMFTFTGEGGATYTLTSASDVEVTSATSFTVTLTGADLINVETLLNKTGTTSATSATTFKLTTADNWMRGAAATADISDAVGKTVTVSNYAVPTITSATYDFNTGALVFTGTDLVAASGATNDIIANKFTFTGDGGATYALTDTSNVEVTSATAFTITLSATDKLAIGGLLNNNGSQSDTASNTVYNINAAEDWIAGAPAANNVADPTGNGVTVSNYATPAITSATYDYNTNQLVVTGTNFVNEVGATNDVDISMFTFTGEGGATYTLTSASDVEITSATAFTVTLAGVDLTNVEALLNKNGTTADSGSTYNLAAADNWMPGAAATTNIADLTGNAITVSNYGSPTITSATYDFGTGALVLTGTDFVSKSGATNDLIANTLTLTGDGGTYTLTDTANVEITSATAATLTLSVTDQLNIRGLLNKNGTASGGAVTYNVAAADNWLAATPAVVNFADMTGNGVTVSNVAAPTVTSATYDSDTGVLVVTGTNLFKKIGATNDIDISTLTLTGGTGNATFTITSASDVEITSATSFSVTLSGADKTNVDSLLDQIGTTSTGGSTYNLAAADNWLTGADATANIADASATVTVSINPKVTSATYDAATGSLVVTGTNMQAQAGVTNDITANKFTLTGEGGATYTLTDTANVEIASATSFTLTLSATDKAALNQIMNKNGTTSTGSTTFNIAAADDWNAQVTAGDTSDATGNGVTVSNVAAPALTSTTYDANSGVLTLTGTGFLKLSGATNDIVANKFTFTGEGGATYTLTNTANVEITSGTAATITLSATDKEQVNRIVNKNGTAATAGTTYNIAAAEDWAAGADAAVNVVDATGNGLTASNVAVPAITSTAYDASAGTLVVTGTGFLSATGATNDVVANKFTFTGEGGATYTLTDSSNVEITSSTAFTITLSATDKSGVNQIMNKNGTTATAGTTYNINAAEDWAAGADAAVNVVDATGNGVTVSNVSVPGITSSTYNAATGALVVTGTGFTKANGGTNDIDVSMFTFTGANGTTYTLTSATDVEITSDTAFTITLSGADKLAVDGLMDKNGTASDGGTTYNLAAAEDWARGADAAVNVADTTATVTVSNTTAPTVTSATYDANTNQLVVTGANFTSKSGAANDIDISMLTLTGEGGATYTLTSTTDVEVTSATAFTVTLSGADLVAVEGLLNKNGTASDGGTTYNLGAADNWAAAAAPSANIADATGNGVTVSNVAAPVITSATYDINTGVVTVTGTNFVSKSGAANDVDVSLLTFTGDGGVTYTLTSATDVEVTSATAFSVTLSGADKLAVDGLLNKNGTASDGGTTYNLAAADNWMTGAAATADIADATGNGITASNYAAPTITSATFNSGTGVVVVTGTGFTSKSGAANDIDLSLLTFTGKAGATYTLTTATDVEITSGTSFTATLSGADLTGVKALLDQTGTAASDATTYNMAGADNWLVAGATSVNIADATNAVTVTVPAVTTTTTSTITLNITQIGAASSPSSSNGEPGGDGGDSGDGVPATVAVPGGTTVGPLGTTARPSANSVEAAPGFTYGQNAADPTNSNALSIISNAVNGRGDVINAFYGAGRSGSAGFRGDDGAHQPTGGMRDSVGNMLGNSVMGSVFGGFSAFGDIGGNEEGENDGGGNDGGPGAGAALTPAGRSSFTNQLAAASGALSADVQRLAAAMSQG